jgi:hypothetical protein
MTTETELKKIIDFEDFRDKIRNDIKKDISLKSMGEVLIELTEEVEEGLIEAKEQGRIDAIDNILELIDDCRKGLLTSQQADILHVKICKLQEKTWMKNN